MVSPWKYLHIEETCATNGNKAVLKAVFIGSRQETGEAQTPTQTARQTNCRLETGAGGGQRGFDI